MLLLMNMTALKHVPGRKTDVKDRAWLAQLLEWGLLRASVVPPVPTRNSVPLVAIELTPLS
jgi:hypothetical protein